MGWNLRKSKGFGPVRFTVTRRGISTSVGAGPLRISRGSDGKYRRTVRIPGTGLYNTQVVGGAKSPGAAVNSSPGFYPDPRGTGGRTYWTGTEWGEPPPLNTTRILLAIFGCLAVLIALAVFGGNETTPSPTTSTMRTTAASTKPLPTAAPTKSVPTASANDLRAQQVVNAIIAAGLPAIDQRDNTARICGDAGCVQLITTDDVSVYQFPDNKSAMRWASVYPSGYGNGTILLAFHEGGSNRTDPALIPQYQAVLDGLMADR
jgi:Protein of unknown function (DUF4236)